VVLRTACKITISELFLNEYTPDSAFKAEEEEEE
jgi:hypothetical protein